MQEVGPGMNLFLQCKSPQEAEQLKNDHLILCNLLIKKNNFQNKKQIRGRQCHKCGKLGHIMGHCTSKKACWTCGEEEYEAKNCQTTKKYILCQSTEHGALYGGCPAKHNHTKEWVKIAQEENKKVKLPIRMRGSKRKKQP